MKKYREQLIRFLSSRQGKRYLHFCYSWGAALVIIGAMFKILHFSYANEMLMVAMSLEAVIFVLSAFDFPEDLPEKEAPPVPARPLNSPAKIHEADYEETLHILTRQMERLTGFIHSVNTVSGEIEKHSFIYGVQIRQMGENLKELNLLYQQLIEQFDKQPEPDEPEDENEILN